ncbi:MAG: alpha-amylase family glycosyl hydrolase [Bryobacteraceae bacterium]|nr:alpha-amylase family glycosyl hydrolase [Bryobacteraceae bacterium]
MPQSVFSQRVTDVFAAAASPRAARIAVEGRQVEITKPFASPADWRDHWIYFLMVDRFAGHAGPPKSLPFDAEFGGFQGGSFDGIRQQLGYLSELGVGALWLSPVTKNCQFEEGTFHGYGFQDFLKVDPRFGSETELQGLIDEAHARGMYIIFDIVLNHAGNVFEYVGHGAAAPWKDTPYDVLWRDATGLGRFSDIAAAPAEADGGVWPEELRKNSHFRRQGKGGELGGDFESLKELVTGRREGSPFGDRLPVQETLIRAYQYLIAKFDVDGYRIDTLKYIEPEFARVFGNAMREYAQSIGKKNFFTFGEVYDEEEKISAFIGRNASEFDEPIGVDAALDFPLFFRLPSLAKGFTAPTQIEAMYRRRKEIQKSILTTHGEASAHFVTFLDNHDQRERIYYVDPADPSKYDMQLTLAVASLFALQGIPCLYYGTEQGLHGRGGSDRAVREALWGKPGGFDRTHVFYAAIRSLTETRRREAALRFGRQYFRPVSGNQVNFGVSPFPKGVLAVSRILNEREVVFVANSNPDGGFAGDVLVDGRLNSNGQVFNLLWSNNCAGAVGPQPAVERPGPIRAVPVTLAPMEAQIIGPA